MKFKLHATVKAERVDTTGEAEIFGKLITTKAANESIKVSFLIFSHSCKTILSGLSAFVGY